jgi:fibronectin-binding autotransporter adhesin
LKSKSRTQFGILGFHANWSVLVLRRRSSYQGDHMFKGEKMRRKSMTLIATAAAATVAGITSNSQAQYVYYRPIVSLVGDGTLSDANDFGALTTIQAFNYAPSSQSGVGATNQTSPIAAFGYADNNSTGPSGSLVTAANSTTEGDLENNPALDDAATAGLPYSGTAYAFSGGYQGSDGTANINAAAAAANRVVGYMSVTGNYVSSGTIGDSMTAASTYVTGNIRSAVGDNTPSDGNFWMAGTGSSNTTAGFTASFRFANANTNSPSNTSTELTTSAANNRRVQIREGQLYGGSSTGNFVGISLVSNNPNPSNLSGLPTTLTSPGVTALFATSFQPPSSSAASPLSFVLMNDPNNSSTPTVTVTVGSVSTPVSIPFNVAYVADDDTDADNLAGIEKWYYNPTVAGGTSSVDNYGWNLAYVIPDPKTSGATAAGNLGLAAEMVLNPSDPTQDSVELFSTDSTTSGTQNYLIQTTDQIDNTSSSGLSAAQNSQVVLAESPTNDDFRGVALAPIVPISANWNNASGGTWSPTSSWTGTGNNSTATNASLTASLIPGSYGDLADTAVFADVAGEGSTIGVTLDTARTVGHLVFNSLTTSYTISGAATLTIDDTGDNVPGSVADITVQAGSHTIATPVNLVNGVTLRGSAGTTLTVSGNVTGSGGLSSVTSGTVVLSGTNTYAGGTSVSAGKTVIATAGALSTNGGVTLSGSGTMQLADNITAGSAYGSSNIALPSLAIAGNGTLDIGNNRIIVDYTPGNDPISSIAQWIANGFTNSGGPEIISSDIASDDSSSGLSYGIGYADGADGLVAGLPSGEIEIMYTLLGDANLDGTVNAEDYTPFSHNIGQSGMYWDDGDFNYDGTVNSEDYTPFSHNIGQSASLAAAPGLPLDSGLENVPEPTSLGLLAAGTLGILARRRRRSL